MSSRANPEDGQHLPDEVQLTRPPAPEVVDGGFLVSGRFDGFSIETVPVVDRIDEHVGPIVWRIARASDLLVHIRDLVPEAIDAWDGTIPVIRARRARPNHVFVFNPGHYSGEFEEKYLRQLMLLSSEAIHNLRSALDYLAYRLVLNGTKTPNGLTQFPVAEERSKFSKEYARRMPGTSDFDRAVVTAVQPFEGVEWAANLQSLSNRDKHRFPVGVVPVLICETNADAKHEDPMRDEQYFAYEVHSTQMTLRFTDTIGRDGGLLDVLETLGSILNGAVELINRVFEEYGVPPIVPVSEH